MIAQAAKHLGDAGDYPNAASSGPGKRHRVALDYLAQCIPYREFRRGTGGETRLRYWRDRRTRPGDEMRIRTPDEFGRYPGIRTRDQVGSASPVHLQIVGWFDERELWLRVLGGVETREL